MRNLIWLFIFLTTVCINLESAQAKATNEPKTAVRMKGLPGSPSGEPVPRNSKGKAQVVAPAIQPPSSTGKKQATSATITAPSSAPESTSTVTQSSALQINPPPPGQNGFSYVDYTKNCEDSAKELLTPIGTLQSKCMGGKLEKCVKQAAICNDKKYDYDIEAAEDSNAAISMFCSGEGDLFSGENAHPCYPDRVVDDTRQAREDIKTDEQTAEDKRKTAKDDLFELEDDLNNAKKESSERANEVRKSLQELQQKERQLMLDFEKKLKEVDSKKAEAYAEQREFYMKIDAKFLELRDGLRQGQIKLNDTIRKIEAECGSRAKAEINRIEEQRRIDRQKFQNGVGSMNALTGAKKRSLRKFLDVKAECLDSRQGDISTAKELFDALIARAKDDEAMLGKQRLESQQRLAQIEQAAADQKPEIFKQAQEELNTLREQMNTLLQNEQQTAQFDQQKYSSIQQRQATLQQEMSKADLDSQNARMRKMCVQRGGIKRPISDSQAEDLKALRDLFGPALQACAQLRNWSNQACKPATPSFCSKLESDKTVQKEFNAAE